MNPQRIARQIQQKNQPYPYSPNPLDIFEIRTDVNEFPYRRFFRGKRFSDKPHLWEREAGFSPLLSTPVSNHSDPYPSLLLAPRATPFQVPCSTQFPSTPTNLTSASQFGCINLNR